MSKELKNKLNAIEAKPTCGRSTHVGYDEDTKEDHVVWLHQTINVDLITYQYDAHWFGDNTDPENFGRWEYHEIEVVS